MRAGLIEQVKTVRGDVRDQALLERMLGEYEIDTVIHLAAQTIVGIANRNPVSTFETNIARDVGAARSVPPQPDGASRSSSPRPTRPTATRQKLPYDETTPLQGAASLRRQQVVRGPDRADLRDTYGLPVADHALRQLLRRRRPELEPHRARHDPIGPPRRAAGHPLRRHATSATTSTSRTARPRTCFWPSCWPAMPRSAGEAFNFSNETQVTVLDLVERILALMGSTLEPDVRERGDDEIRTVPERGEGAQRARLGAAVLARRGAAADDRLVPRLLSERPA